MWCVVGGLNVVHLDRPSAMHRNLNKLILARRALSGRRGAFDGNGTRKSIEVILFS